MGDYHKYSRAGNECHQRVIRPGLQELVLAAKYDCSREHGLRPILVQNKRYYYHRKEWECMECGKELRELDQTYGCKECQEYLCVECATGHDNQPNFICEVQRDAIVRNRKDKGPKSYKKY